MVYLQLVYLLSPCLVPLLCHNLFPHLASLPLEEPTQLKAFSRVFE